MNRSWQSSAQNDPVVADVNVMASVWTRVACDDQQHGRDQRVADALIFSTPLILIPGTHNNTARYMSEHAPHNAMRGSAVARTARRKAAEACERCRDKRIKVRPLTVDAMDRELLLVP